MIRIKRSALTSDIFIHSFKTALACVIGIIICAFFHVYNSLWLILTILVVMGYQTHFGGALHRSYVRAIGTIIGAAIAAATLYFSGHNIYINTVVIFLTVLWFSYFTNGHSTVKDAGILGAITTVTILMTETSNLSYAMIRVLEILMGILIALLVSKLVFPIHARAQLLKKFALNFRRFAELYHISFENIKTRKKLPHVQLIEEETMSSFTDLCDLIPNAKNELSGIPYNKALSESMLSYQRRLFRSMIFIYQALNKEPEKFKTITHIAKLEEFNQTVMQALIGLAETLEGKSTLPDLENLNQAHKDLEYSIKHARRRPMDTIVHIDAMLFCIRHIVDEISVLQVLIGTYRSL